MSNVACMAGSTTDSTRASQSAWRSRFGLAGILVLASLLLAPATGSAAPRTVLLMVEQAHCEWCETWDEDIGGIYHRTDEGKRAPLHRVDISDPMPDGVELTGQPHFTPTFILLHDQREVGRIEGYPGEHFFWPMLQQLLAKLPPAGAPDPVSRPSEPRTSTPKTTKDGS